MKMQITYPCAPYGAHTEYLYWEDGLPSNQFTYTAEDDVQVTIYPSDKMLGECTICTYSIDNTCDETPCLIRII